MWWTKPYVNRRDWILENLGVLNVSGDQALLLLMIDYLNTQKEIIDPQILSNRTGLKPERVDELIHQLVRQNILEIKPLKDRIEFNIDRLFQEGLLYEYVDETIFEIFEGELARPLSQSELERLNSWLNQYTQEEIISALRTAIVYQKVTFPYINSILANNRKEKGLSL
mgnify:CR=1 FL=1